MHTRSNNRNERHASNSLAFVLLNFKQVSTKGKIGGSKVRTNRLTLVQEVRLCTVLFRKERHDKS